VPDLQVLVAFPLSRIGRTLHQRTRHGPAAVLYSGASPGRSGAGHNSPTLAQGTKGGNGPRRYRGRRLDCGELSRCGPAEPLGTRRRCSRRTRAAREYLRRSGTTAAGTRRPAGQHRRMRALATRLAQAL